MRRVAALLLLLAAGVTPARAQLVNGGFEPAGASASYHLLPGGSTAIPGWTTVLSGVEWFRPTLNGAAPDSPAGGYAVDLADYTFPSGGIEQTFATAPGTSYTIDFWFGTHAAFGRDGTATITATVDDTTHTFSHTSLTGTIGWSARSLTFVADDATATLRFTCTQNPLLHFAYIDGASLAAITPTDGATWGRIKRLYR